MIYKFENEKAALLIIDMQRGFIEENAAMEVAPGRKIIPNIQQLMAACRRLNIPVIFTRFIYSTKVPNLIGELHTLHKPPVGCCLEGDPSAEVVSELSPQSTELIIDKHSYDAFHKTPLDYALRSLKKSQLIFTGVMTDICVLSTVTSALHNEYQTWTISDATATIWPNVQGVTLDLIERAYGIVTDTKKMIDQISD